MTNIINKITSYDFLGIFIPGSVGMIMITLTLSEKELPGAEGRKVVGENTVLAVTLLILMFFTGAYTLGLIINEISDGIWRGFRNNEGFIELQIRRLLQRNPAYQILTQKFHISFSSSEIQYYSVTYLIALLALCKQIWERWIEFFCNKPLKSYGSLERQYYSAYYWLLERGKISSVSVIETQVTLLRNLLLPLGCCFLCLKNLCIQWWQLLLLLVVIFFTMLSRQNRIYSIILEDYQNYKSVFRQNEIFNSSIA